MIVRFGGGNSGIAEYLEKGAKHDRHYSRDELDNRIIIDGDLEVTNKIINDIADKGQDRYLHITLSFNEPDITVETIQAVYEDYKRQFLTAYKEDEINTYAEIHWPKTQQLLNKSTQEMYDRFPHIHMVIPKHNLLTGGYTNPVGYHLKNVNIWDAIQEDVNNKHGLKSPAHSPRISLENYKAVLDRHKVSQFKSKDGDFKKSVFDTIEKQQVYSWQDFKDVVSSYGEIKVRNQGKDTEYYAVKLPDNDKFTNLNNPVFSKSYIEKREIPHKPLTQYQINNRLKQWEVVSKEIKYIDDASTAAKKAYRTLDDEQKVSFLKKTETHFYEEYDEKEIPESKRAQITFRQSYSKFDRGRETDRRSLHDLPALDVVHGRTARGNLTRAELLLSPDEIRDIQLTEADSDAGLQRSIHSTARVILDKEQIKSLSSQIIFDIEENTAIDKANDLQLFKEIRTNLKPELVLAYSQANHLINPEEHTFFRAKDGSARIAFGKYNYNVSDFFTKGLGLEWKETEVILKSLYEAQNTGLKVEPVSNNTLKECLIGFEEDIYSVKLEEFKRVSNTIDKDESLSIKQINARYFTENRRISKLEFTTWSERENLKSINAFEKLVAEEHLKAIMFGSRQDANSIKYPFSDHFEKYLTQQKVIDMSLINNLKEKYAKPQEAENELENSIGGKGFDFVLNGKEAARRAKLTANLARQGQPNTRYGYSFKELTPNQQKDSVVFSHGGKKLFETKANRTKVLGGLDFDKTATALVYSMQRYGNPLDINGTEKFREQIIEVAARNELKVEFTDPALNEALKNRLAELGMEAANENSIAAEDLELDKSLGERAAVDKAMLESKQREIETDLKEPNPAALDLAAIAIAQRLNAHEHEPITAETAALDTAVYNELKQTPALQAYFAVEMSKIGAANTEYRAEFIKNEPEEFMLANHAARKFTDELETTYQANKPQEELDLTLDEAVFKEQTEELSLSALYAAELILHEDKRTDFGTATDTTALDAWDVSSKQYELLTARIAERLESGEIPSDLQSQAEPDYLDAAKDIVLATNFKTIDSEALKTLTGEDFERPSFESIQPEAPVIEPEAIEPTTDLINEPTFDDSGAAALSSLESLQIERLKGGHSHQETFVTDDMLISIQKTDDGWQVLSGENTGAMHEVLQTERLDDALDYYESNKTLGMQVEQATPEESMESDAIFNSKTQDFIAQLESSEHLISYDESKTLSEQFAELKSGAASSLILEGNDNNQNFILIENAENGWQVTQGDAHFSADDFTEEDCPPEYIPFETSSFEEAVENMAQREGNLSMAEKLEQQQSEPEAVFNSKTQDFIAQLESSEHLISYDESKTLSEQFAELKSGAASSLILEGNDNNQNFILIENAENGWQVTQGDAHFSADDFTEEDCPPEYIPFETSSFEEAVENMAQREGNLSMAEKLEQQQSEPEASVAESEKTLDTEKPEPILVGYTAYNAGTFEEQLEDVKSKRVFTGTPVSMRVFDDSEAFEKFNSQIESGERSHSNEILKGDKFINIEPVENGWQVRTGSPHWDAEAIAEDKSAIAKYDVFHASSLDEAVKNFTERTEGFEERGNQISVKTDWAMILETFEKEPAPLSVENAGDKNTANQISELKAPESEQEAKEIAETLSTGLKELRGKPELRQAALAAVALVDSSPLLQGEMAEIAESDNFVKVVLETTRTYSDDLQMTRSAPDVDMDM